ncbi:29481_t:CDS:1, partial [Racocetra persica]
EDSSVNLFFRPDNIDELKQISKLKVNHLFFNQNQKSNVSFLHNIASDISGKQLELFH